MSKLLNFLPKTTYVNRVVAKDRISTQLAKNTQVKQIRWYAKLAPTTINLPSKNLIEIEIFTIEMAILDTKVLSDIQAKIPHKIIFIVNDDWIGSFYYKRLYGRKMLEALEIRGLSIDEIQENFLRQILELKQSGQPLAEQIKHYNQKQEIKKQIETLSKQIRRTPIGVTS
ncbi:hypothetical protein RyT2_06360 [Pseudolactococcus yaeyamensis]